MERIQEAIEKAKTERNKNQVNPRAQSNYSDKSQNSEILPSAIKINYSKTQTIRISEEELKNRKIVAGIAHDERSEPYRRLRSQLLKKMRSDNLRTLAITSPTSGNGKTLTAINLAISLSKEVNQTVMLIDLDLKTPSVAKTFGLTNIKTGITDIIDNNIALEDILINPGYERLVIAPGTPQGSHTSEILSSPAMRQLQMELYNRYDDRLIIYDLPPLLISDDALVFAPNADATILVVEDGGNSEADLKRSVSLLEDANFIGTVINKLL